MASTLIRNFLNLFVKKTGDTMTGNLIMSNDSKVGIGKTNPAEQLEVFDTTADDYTTGTSVKVIGGVNVDKYAYQSVDFALYNAANPSPTQTFLSMGGEGVLDNSGGVTDYDFYVYDSVAGGYRLHIDSSGRVSLGTTSGVSKLTLAAATTAAGGITFGTDTNIYRSAADTLKTDDNLTVGANFLSVGTPSTSIGGYAGAGTQSLSTTLYDQSRLQNLVTNGNGLLGNNYNFTSFTFDATELHGGGGSFKKNVSQIGYTSDEYIPIDPEKYYRLVGWAKAGDTGGGNFNAANIQYLGISPFDIDNLSVGPHNYSKYPGSTDTTLTVALVNGATTMTVANATGWYSGAIAFNRNFVYWPYTNSKGYTYPNYTYTRNDPNPSDSVGLWTNGGISGNVITLTTPWAGGTLPIGTPVRNRSSGGTFKYIAAAAVNVPNAWTRYEGYIGSLDTAGNQDQNTIPYGTAYLKLLFLVNYHGAADNNIRWSDLWFSEMSSRNLEVATASVPGVVSTSAQSMGAGNKYFSGSIHVGGTSPTARLHLPAGTSTASTAPLKLTSGTSLATPEAGAVEFDGSHFYGTIGTTRYQLDNQGIILISTTTGINAKSTGTTTLYTVPAGKTFIPMSAMVRCTAASAITVGPTLGIGVAAGEDDIYASTAINALTTTAKIFSFSTIGMSVSVAAAGVVKVGIDTASTGTSQTIAIDLMGYLL